MSRRVGLLMWLALVGAMQPSMACAQLWKKDAFVTVFDNGDVYTIDPATIEQKSGAPGRRAWIRGDHRANSKVRFRSSMQLVSFDCEGRALTSAYSTYDERGNEVDTWDGVDRWRAVRPGSLHSWAMVRVCAYSAEPKAP